MFTGIIEHLGMIESLDLHGDGGHVTIHAPTVAPLLAVSNSIAVNGCCLTVVSLDKNRFSADLSGETIRKTSFGADGGNLAEEMRVNLEQPLTAGKEFGGHFVLGHVDTIGRIAQLTPEGEGWTLDVHIPDEFVRHIVHKGSITVDGISLTAAMMYLFPIPTVRVAVIPYTYEHTNLRDRRPGDAVNLEGDILGKYVERHLAARDAVATATTPSNMSIRNLVDQGF
jgi:riboflavin synthase